MFLYQQFHLLLCQEVALKFYHVVAQQDTGSRHLATWWLTIAVQRWSWGLITQGAALKIRVDSWIIEEHLLGFSLYNIYVCMYVCYMGTRTYGSFSFTMTNDSATVKTQSQIGSGYPVYLLSFPPSYV